jgi:uncharacterized protein (TIGR02145 family)
VKTQNRNWLYPFIIILGLLCLAGFCKKDDDSPSTTITDKDGNVYTSVTIGTQVWMVENLKTTKYYDGTAIPNITDKTDWDALITPGYCWYNNNASTYKATYGAMYNWYAVNTGKLCPVGWHVPTYIEWQILETYLGGSSVAGSKLKESGITHWKSPNTGATNETGFTALPGGRRTSTYLFDAIEVFGNWWSSSVSSDVDAFARMMRNDNSSFLMWFSFKCNGLSVRCLKDN